MPEQTLTESSLFHRQVPHTLYILSKSILTTLWGKSYSYLHFTQGQTEIQRSISACSGSLAGGASPDGQQAASLAPNSALQISKLWRLGLTLLIWQGSSYAFAFTLFNCRAFIKNGITNVACVQQTVQGIQMTVKCLPSINMLIFHLTLYYRTQYYWFIHIKTCVQLIENVLMGNDILVHMNIKSLKLKSPLIWLEIYISFLARIPETKIPNVHYIHHCCHTKISKIGIFNFPNLFLQQDHESSRVGSFYFYIIHGSKKILNSLEGFRLGMSPWHTAIGAIGSQVLVAWPFLAPTHRQPSDPRITNTLSGERLVRGPGKWNLDTQGQNPYWELGTY